MNRNALLALIVALVLVGCSNGLTQQAEQLEQSSNGFTVLHHS